MNGLFRVFWEPTFISAIYVVLLESGCKAGSCGCTVYCVEDLFSDFIDIVLERGL